MNISCKFDGWPERAEISVRLHLYTKDKAGRCDLQKLLGVFRLAAQYNVQENISTNLNRLNAVSITLNNYVLRHRGHHYGWGDHWGFLLALITAFPRDVYVDPPSGTPEETQGTRFALLADGEIAEEIQTWDDMC